MRHSIVARLTFLIAVIITLSFTAWVAIVHRSTSVTFLEVRTEVLSGAPAPAADADLRRVIERAYADGGWDAVQRAADDPAASGLEVEVAFLVMDTTLAVAAATDAELRTARITEGADGLLRIRSSFAGGEQAAELEVASSEPGYLRSPGGEAFGRLVVLPAPLDATSGERFATKVWRSAALWLGGVVLLAVVATAFVMRRALAPIDRLTRAAHELRAGAIPPRLQRDGASEFGELIDAFNAATASLATTDELRKRLVADVSHELRTPLTNLKAQLEASQAGLIPFDGTLVETLQSETRLLERLVEDFHALAVSDAGQLRLNLQVLPLRETVGDIVVSLADAYGAAVRVDPAEELEVVADEERLRQVIVNLMENAARHKTSGLEIDVRVRDEGTHATFYFADNGPGIAEEDRPHVFERFYRAERSRSRVTGGAGLGLAIVEGIVEAMGGTVRLDDGAGGATFAVSLPKKGPPEGR